MVLTEIDAGALKSRKLLSASSIEPFASQINQVRESQLAACAANYKYSCFTRGPITLIINICISTTNLHNILRSVHEYQIAAPSGACIMQSECPMPARIMQIFGVKLS